MKQTKMSAGGGESHRAIQSPHHRLAGLGHAFMTGPAPIAPRSVGCPSMEQTNWAARRPWGIPKTKQTKKGRPKAASKYSASALP
jgi:hypothetical protein